MAGHRHLRDSGMIPSTFSLVHLCRQDEENLAIMAACGLHKKY